MGERKVLNKYIPADFDPALVPRGKKLSSKDGTVPVRMMLPFSMQCSNCGEFLYRGRKYNSKKEAVQGPDGRYLGIQRWRFYIKCNQCARPITFTTDGNIEGADVAGFLSTNSELDYFNLGSITSGNTVFLSISYPDGSTLVPIVAVYNSSGVLQTEVNGVDGDDSAEVQINANDTYHALVRPNLTSAGMMSQYVLNARILPTNAVHNQIRNF